MFESIDKGDKRYVDQVYRDADLDDLMVIPVGTTIEAVNPAYFWQRNVNVKATTQLPGGFINGRRHAQEELMDIKKHSFFSLPPERRKLKIQDGSFGVRNLARKMSMDRAIEIQSAVRKVLGGKNYGKGLRQGDDLQTAQAVIMASDMCYADYLNREGLQSWNSYIPKEHIFKDSPAENVTMGLHAYRMAVKAIANKLVRSITEESEHN